LDKLKARQILHEKSKRELPPSLVLGTSMSLLPTIGIPVDVVTVVGIIVVGIVGVVKNMNRLSELEASNANIKTSNDILHENQEETARKKKKWKKT
jgi:Mg2+/citrate symporter